MEGLGHTNYNNFKSVWVIKYDKMIKKYYSEVWQKS
jgi:hypothetical protein